MFEDFVIFDTCPGIGLTPTFVIEVDLSDPIGILTSKLNALSTVVSSPRSHDGLAYVVASRRGRYNLSGRGGI